MRFYPNSYGTRPVREYNPHHEPGGSAKGGQFAKANAPGSTQSTGEPPHQPVLTDQTTGSPKLSPAPQPEEEHGLQVERPKGTSKKSAAGAKGNVTSFDDDSGNADEALGALGVNQSAEHIARGMVSAIDGETFRATVSVSGDSESSSYDGPDPEEVQSTYDEWAGERASEVGGEAHTEQHRDYIRQSEHAYQEASAHINQALSAASPEGKLLTADMSISWDSDQADHQAAADPVPRGVRGWGRGLLRPGLSHRAQQVLQRPRRLRQLG